MEKNQKERKDHSMIIALMIMLFIAAGFILIIRMRINLGNLALPFYLVATGMFLFASALEMEGGMGEVIAAMSGIPTILGLILLYQFRTGNWESWAYVWPLIFPAGAGLGQICYGNLKANREAIERGKILAQVGFGMSLLGLVLYGLIFS
ncbi:hypothetical protein MSMTP_2931 [Methanosarcina sp. MTP4]|uniref:hypothetical protein n=1 Tax=Methanosarcina sp. MTP4 TaxID=1434100 RepID=UPI0006158903|nr:hypothetical protein [Methanosarcina sp. MTP4]AKB26400.1 hypothetical protein MSMTP_2931 [Methanosarcina sp. MTP4]